MLHYRTRISGTEVRKKLPFRVLVLGDFTGPDAHTEPQNSKGEPLDIAAVSTVPHLSARPVRSFRFGKAGGRVDHFMAELLPYVKLPDHLKTILPGRLEDLKLSGSLPLSAQAGTKVQVKLSGTATFRSLKEENGLCDVSGPVHFKTTREIDPGLLSQALSVKLEGGGKARGLLTIPLKDEPVGVVAGIVRLDMNITVKFERLDPEKDEITAVLQAPPATPAEQRRRASMEADSIAREANDLKIDAGRQEQHANVTAPATPSGLPAEMDALLTAAKTDIDALIADAKAAVTAYKAASEAVVGTIAPLDALVVAAQAAPDDAAAANKAVGGAHVARVALKDAGDAATAARDAVGQATGVVGALNDAIAQGKKTLAGLDSMSPADKATKTSEVTLSITAAMGRIAGAKALIAASKGDAELAKQKVDEDVKDFDTKAAAPAPAASTELPMYAERVLPFDSLSAFSPDEVASNVPELTRLGVIRQLLVTLQSELRNTPELRDALRAAVRGDKAGLELLKEELKTDYNDLAIDPTR